MLQPKKIPTPDEVLGKNNIPSPEDILGVEKKNPNSTSTTPKKSGELVQKDGSLGTPKMQTFEGFDKANLEKLKGQPQKLKQITLKPKEVVKNKEQKLDLPSPNNPLEVQKPFEVAPKKELTESENTIIANQAYDYAIKNYDEQKSIERLNDELNVRQFTDGIKDGLKGVFNTFVATPLSVANVALGGNKDFRIGEYKPLESELKTAKKELEEELGGKTPIPQSQIQKRAEEIFIKKDKIEQLSQLIDESLPSGYDREGVWKELKLDQLKSNDKLRSTIASVEVFKNQIQEFENYAKKIKSKGVKNGFSQEETEQFNLLREKAIGAVDGLKYIKGNYDNYLKEAKTDNEKLELFKYNYDDFEKNTNLLWNTTKNIVAGTTKLIADTATYASNKVGLENPLSEAFSEMSSEELNKNEKENEQFYRYKASNINSWSDLGSLSSQLFSEQVPVLASIYMGGNAGVAAVSLSSGGQKINELEEQAKQPFGKIYSDGEKLVAGYLYAGAEFFPEKFGTARILKDLERTVSSASSASRKLFTEGFLKNTLSGIKKTSSNTFLEGGTEYITAEGQIAIDSELLGIIESDYEKNQKRSESFLSGGLMGGAMSAVGGSVGFGVAQSKLYSDRKDIKRVQEILSNVDVINSEIENNKLLSESEKKELYSKMNEMNNEAFSIVEKNAMKGANLSVREKSFLLDINERQSSIKEKANEIKNSNYSKELKKSMLNDLKSEFETLEQNRNKTLNGEYNASMDSLIKNQPKQNAETQTTVTETKLQAEVSQQTEAEKVKSKLEHLDDYHKKILEDEKSYDWQKEMANEYFSDKRKSIQDSIDIANKNLKENPDSGFDKETIRVKEEILRELDEQEKTKETPKPQEVSPTEDVVAPSVVEGETKKINGKELTFYKLEGDNTDSGFAVEKNKDGYVIQSALLPFSKQKQGIGTDFYVRINNESIEKTGSPLKSSENLSNSGGKPFWEKLVDKGLAEKTEDGFKFKEQTKVTNETAPSQDSTIDGNVRLGASNVGESGITKQQSPAKESIQSANDVKPTEGEAKITKEPTLEDISNFLNENFKPNETNNGTKETSPKKDTDLRPKAKQSAESEQKEIEVAKKWSLSGRTPMNKRKFKGDMAKANAIKPSDVRSMVLSHFLRGAKVASSEISQQGELKAKNNGFYGIATSKGKTIDAIAHDIWESQENQTLKLDTSTIKDMVEEVISMHNKVQDIADSILKAYGIESSKNQQEFEEDLEVYQEVLEEEKPSEQDLMEANLLLAQMSDAEILELVSEQEKSYEDYLKDLEERQVIFEFGPFINQKGTIQPDGNIVTENGEFIPKQVVSKIEYVNKKEVEVPKKEAKKQVKPDATLLKEVDKKIEEARQKVRAAKDALDRKAKSLDKEMVKDQENLFGERKSSAEAKLFDERVDAQAREKATETERNNIKTAQEELKKLIQTKKDIESGKINSNQIDLEDVANEENKQSEYKFSESPSLKNAQAVDSSILPITPKATENILKNEGNWDKAIIGDVKNLGNGWFEVGKTVKGESVLYSPTTDKAVTIIDSENKGGRNAVYVNDFINNNPTISEKQQRKDKANADKSILNSDKDLLGDEKEEAMIPLTYEQNPDFNVDDVVYIKSDRDIDKFGKRNQYSVRGKDENGKYVLWGKSNGANLSVDFSEIEKGVNQKRYPLTGSLDAIDYAMGEKLYSEWVKEGRMSASDAKIIIESAGFNVPSDIEKLARKNKANSEVDKIADKIKQALPGIKDPNLKKQGFSQDELIDLVANAVKNLISAGIEIDEAIRQVVASIKDRYNIDVNTDDVKAKIEPKKEVKEDTSLSKKEFTSFRDLIKNIPESGNIKKYLSGETIAENYGNPENAQEYDAKVLVDLSKHGLEVISKAKELFGEKYIEKTLEFLEDSDLNTFEKAIQYVALMNEMDMRLQADPNNLSDKKLQKLVYAKYQANARIGSLTINVGRLMSIMKYGVDPNRQAEKLLTSKQKEAKLEIEKIIQVTPEQINEFEDSANDEIEKAISEGVEKKINEIYSKLPTSRRIKADKAITALENIQKKLRGKAYDATIGVPIAIIDSSITVIKSAIKAGVNIADAIELGINHIKEKYGKEWTKEDEFRKDMFAGFKAEGVDTSKVEKSIKDTVKELLIEAGFSREVKSKGETKVFFDWKKLAGEEGSVDKIKENVENVLKSKGYSESEIKETSKSFEDEYNRLSEEIINKGLAELENRNLIKPSPNRKLEAKRLAELYNYGLMDSESVKYDNIMNKVLGLSDLDAESYRKIKNATKALADIFNSKRTQGKLTEQAVGTLANQINHQIKVILQTQAFRNGPKRYKIASMASELAGLAQKSLLQNPGNAIENVLSGVYASIISRGIGKFKKELTPEMRKQNKLNAKIVFDDINSNAGLFYGDTNTSLISESRIEEWLNGKSDNRVYHAILSALNGRMYLEATDSMIKSDITNSYFAKNVIEILTNKSNPEGAMTREEALKYVSDNTTGVKFEEALKEAKRIIDEINSKQEEKQLADSPQAIHRFAMDIVRDNIISGGRMTQEQVEKSYIAGYKSAGRDIGHVANNWVSKSVGFLNSNLQTSLENAVKEKDWNRATLLSLTSIITKNIMNPFVGGGTNWVVRNVTKAGLANPLSIVNIISDYAMKKEIDLSTETGRKNLEEALYRKANLQSTTASALVGTIITMLIFAGLKANDDEGLLTLDQWLKENEWAKKYFDKLSPESATMLIALEDEKLGQHYIKSFGMKTDIFDENLMLLKSLDKEDSSTLGIGASIVASPFTTPGPWRMYRDIQNIKRGLNGITPIKSDPKITGFWNGVFKGGFVDYLGYRPEAKYGTKEEIEFFRNQEKYSKEFLSTVPEKIAKKKENILKGFEGDIKKLKELKYAKEKGFKIYYKSATEPIPTSELTTKEIDNYIKRYEQAIKEVENMK